MAFAPGPTVDRPQGSARHSDRVRPRPIPAHRITGMTRIGIIGTGWGARVQVPAFREAGLDVVAIAGHDSLKTRQTARELELTPFDDWHELVTMNVDLVTIVTPPSE